VANYPERVVFFRLFFLINIGWLTTPKGLYFSKPRVAGRQAGYPGEYDVLPEPPLFPRLPPEAAGGGRGEGQGSVLLVPG